MSQTLTIIIVEKGGSLKQLSVKDYKKEELYKKCGFKKENGFSLQTEWNVKIDGEKYTIMLYGKIDGKAGMENKYDFPPPVDTTLFFGSCALVALSKKDNIKTDNNSVINLTVPLWNKIYEKLFGGFDDLALTCGDDEEEEDELEKIPKSMKTKKGGYLKDGFVVDSSDTEEDECSASETEDEDDTNLQKYEDIEEEILLEDIGSELSEEEYEYSDEETNDKV
jgi:hypothetical protein